MDLTRRKFFKVSKGAAAAAVLAGLGLSCSPRKAHAIVGIDDALLGAVVVAVATLGGYALYNQYSGNLGLQAVGASFGSYVSSAPNRTAAAAAAAQIAATYGLTTTQERFSTAADSIANGAGAFADALASASDTGRLVLDGLVSGSDELVGAFRELVSGWLASGSLVDVPQTVPSITTIGTSGGAVSLQFGIASLQQMRAMVNGPAIPSGYNSGWMEVYKNWANLGNGSGAGVLYLSEIVRVTESANGGITVVTKTPQMRGTIKKRTNPDRLVIDSFSTYSTTSFSFGQPRDSNWYITPDLVGAQQLPAVDRPVDAPDVIGAGWDSVPIATDMVISPTTGDIVSAGSVTLPTGVPTTAGDYAAALQGALAGVVTDAIALPLALSVPVTVATPLGVETMPISQAISTETSLQLDYAPDVPITPVLPPVEIPEGPWTPVVDLPFNQLWPFNMIYSVVELFQTLGGS